MKQISQNIGERLKELRGTRGLTLEDAAELTGVSKPMLGQIERGQSSPTINTLWKISAGLKIPLSFLCRQKETEVTAAGPEEQSRITEEDGGMRAYPLFPFDPLRNVEIFYLEFDPGVRHSSEAHEDGVEEYILMIGGKLKMTAGTEEAVVEGTQSVRFRADVPHVYENVSETVCTAYNVIFYPDR